MLTTDDIAKVRALTGPGSGLDAAVTLALIKKESNGVALSDGAAVIRIEGHYFFKQLKLLAPDKLDMALELGLASPKTEKKGGVRNGKTQSDRRRQLKDMIHIHEEAAYRSISMGLGQIMGTHYKRLGFVSAKAMFIDACKGSTDQIAQIVGFLRTDDILAAAVRRRDYKTIALLYNGKNAPPSYAKDLETYTKLFDGGNWVEFDEDVERIRALGFDSVRDFQKAAGLTPDGVIGVNTRAAVMQAAQERKKEVSAPVSSAIKGVLSAGGTVAVGVGIDSPDAVNKALTAVTSVIDTATQVAHKVLALGGTGIVVVAVFVGGWYGWKWYKARKAVQPEIEALNL